MLAYDYHSSLASGGYSSRYSLFLESTVVGHSIAQNHSCFSACLLGCTSPPSKLSSQAFLVSFLFEVLAFSEQLLEESRNTHFLEWRWGNKWEEHYASKQTGLVKGWQRGVFKCGSGLWVRSLPKCGWRDHRGGFKHGFQRGSRRTKPWVLW